MEALVKAIRQEKEEKKEIETGKEEVNQLLFTDGMTII
jgi:hypothetical protein